MTIIEPEPDEAFLMVVNKRTHQVSQESETDSQVMVRVEPIESRKPIPSTEEKP